jgi:hypothetical protein
MRQDDFGEIDTSTPSPARVYDYILGGKDNYAVDRALAAQMEEMLPGTGAVMRNNRRYLERVVRFLAADCGIRQFIDNGSGLPTQNNVHQIAQAIDPAGRVVYVDRDPIVLRHQQVRALTGSENTAFILADARDVAGIVNHPQTRRLVDFSQPVAVLYLSFLHFIPDEDDPWGMVRGMMSRVAPGSYLAISTVISDEANVRDSMSEWASTSTKGQFGRIRSQQEAAGFFAGLDLVEPGFVDISTWRPDDRQEEQSRHWVQYGGVARKPG